MVLRIGTRDSELATWQARLVQGLLQEQGFTSELVFITTDGDADLTTPLYELGVQGIFTKSLDVALLQNKIDLAVHSMKDVPTTYARGLTKAAVLKRGNYKDCFVSRLSENTILQNDTASHGTALVATSSIRRMAQWLYRFPQHRITDIRGNVNTRLKKLEASNWDGAIFAAAGLERINKRPAHAMDLDWMLPAPAQGAIMIMARANDTISLDAAFYLNDTDTELCTSIEKAILHQLMGGCSLPISALAEINNDELYVVASLLSPDGRKKIGVQKIISREKAPFIAKEMADKILKDGGQEILDKIQLERND